MLQRVTQDRLRFLFRAAFSPRDNAVGTHQNSAAFIHAVYGRPAVLYIRQAAGRTKLVDINLRTAAECDFCGGFSPWLAADAGQKNKPAAEEIESREPFAAAFDGNMRCERSGPA